MGIIGTYIQEYCYKYLNITDSHIMQEYGNLWSINFKGHAPLPLLCFYESLKKLFVRRKKIGYYITGKLCHDS